MTRVLLMLMMILLVGKQSILANTDNPNKIIEEMVSDIDAIWFEFDSSNNCFKVRLKEINFVLFYKKRLL